MCSIVLLYRPGHDWPVLIGANRDAIKVAENRLLFKQAMDEAGLEMTSGGFAK